MDTAAIDQAFNELMGTYLVHRKIGITASHTRVLRNHLRSGKAISLEKKTRLLANAGWKPEEHQYTHQDILSAVNFCIQAGATAKTFGAAYIVDKWKAAGHAP